MRAARTACIALFRCALILALLALTGGCAMVRVAYNNAEPLVRYMAHDYFDLNEKQNEQFRKRLLEFHDWHRANELPLYAGLLRTAAQRGEKSMTREDVAWAAEQIRARYRVIVTKAVEDAAPILVTLSAAQLRELEARLAKANDKYAKDVLSGDETNQFHAQSRRLLNRFKDWTGPLSDAQETRIEQFVRLHLKTTAMRFENRKRWQKEAVALMRQTRSARELAPKLADIFVQPAQHRLPEFVQALVVWESDLTDLLLDIERSLTPEQRRHVLHRMQRYAEDFDQLAAQRTASAAAPAK